MHDSKRLVPYLPGSQKEATQVIGGDFYACGCGKWSTSKLTESGVKMIEFDLNTNDCEALLRHCESFVPEGDDPKEKQRLLAGLDVLREALIEHLKEDAL